MTHAEQFIGRESFEALVQSLLKETGGGSFGRLHILSIRPMLDEEHWRVLLPKAVAIAERILQLRLGPTDACLPVAGGQFMLLFPTLSEAEGRIRANAIAREIKEHLVGTESGFIDIATEVMPLTMLRQAEGPPTIDTMRTVVETGTRSKGILLSVEYQPVWDGARQAVVGNRARPRRDFGDQVMYEGAVLFGGEQDPLAIAVNGRLAQAGAAYPRGRGALILPLTINTHTLAVPNAVNEWLDTVAAVHASETVIELSGTIAETARPTLRAIVAAIRARKFTVAVRMVPERDTGKFLHDCGVAWLCLDLRQARGASFTPSAIYALFTLVSHDLAGLGLGLALWNAGSAEDIKRASALGFTMFTGTPIGPTARTPVTPHGLSQQGVFA